MAFCAIVSRRKRYLEQLCSLNKKLHRTFDLAPDDTLGIEFARAKNFPQEWADFVIVRADAIGHRIYSLWATDRPRRNSAIFFAQ